MNDDASPSPDPSGNLKTLDPRAVSAWRVSWLIVAAVSFALWVALVVGLNSASILDFVPFGLLLLLGGALVAGVVIWYVPRVTWRQWRYAIRDDEVELHSGIIERRLTLIPMSRVQFVDFRQGPVDRFFGLATIIIHTAGGSRDIPGIAVEEAEPLRNRIAALANIHDDL